MAFLADANWLATADEQGHVSIWDLEIDELIGTLQQEDSVPPMVWPYRSISKLWPWRTAVAKSSCGARKRCAPMIMLESS